MKHLTRLLFGLLFIIFISAVLIWGACLVYIAFKFPYVAATLWAIGTVYSIGSFIE